MYRVIGFKPNEGGGYTVLGVKRTKTETEGNVDEIKNIPLTESVYKKIITENPDADDVMNKLGVKPSVKKEATKAETPKKSEYKLSELTVDFINGLGEGEVVIVDGIKRVKQGSKLKKVKKKWQTIKKKQM